MLPVLKAIPIISSVIEIGKSLYDWWDEKEEKPEEVKPEPSKKVRDRTPLTDSQIEMVIAVFNREGRDTQVSKTIQLNTLFGLDKSVTTYRNIWKDSKVGVS